MGNGLESVGDGVGDAGVEALVVVVAGDGDTGEDVPVSVGGCDVVWLGVADSVVREAFRPFVR